MKESDFYRRLEEYCLFALGEGEKVVAKGLAREHGGREVLAAWRDYQGKHNGGHSMYDFKRWYKAEGKDRHREKKSDGQMELGHFDSVWSKIGGRH